MYSRRYGVYKNSLIELFLRQLLTKRDREVIENTWSRVKIKSKLTNFMKLIRIEGYNGKYGSNPKGIREISDVLLKFDQIGR